MIKGPQDETRADFDKLTARYIGLMFASSWTPLPGATAVVQLKAEYDITKFGFERISPTVAEQFRDDIVRYFVRKRFVLKSASSIPYAGSTMSVIHVYGLSRFILAVAEHRDAMNALDMTDESLKEMLDSIWPEFDQLLWDGDAVLSFYEDITGLKTPAPIAKTFGTVLMAIKKQYDRLAEHLPGFDALQKHGEAISYKAGVVAENVANTGFDLAHKAFESGEKLTADTLDGVRTLAANAADGGKAVASRAIQDGEKAAADALSTVRDLAKSAAATVDAGADVTSEFAKEAIDRGKQVTQSGVDKVKAAHQKASAASRLGLQKAKSTLNGLLGSED
ncbi:MAG: hypothetical protein VYA30_09440 [Myxococcota bacterium]|nr:hypothetical protein [Myxococcota bacterium]